MARGGTRRASFLAASLAVIEDALQVPMTRMMPTFATAHVSTGLPGYTLTRWSGRLRGWGRKSVARRRREIWLHVVVVLHIGQCSGNVIPPAKEIATGMVVVLLKVTLQWIKSCQCKENQT